MTNTKELDTSKAVKVHIDWTQGPFADNDPDSFAGESPWAVPVGEDVDGGLYQLVNQPLTPGLGWGDIVRCKDLTHPDGITTREVVELVERNEAYDEEE